MTLSDRAAIAIARYEEVSLRDAGKPYGEAVIQLCDMWLNMFDVKERSYIEMTQPERD